jgi:hypothetical protein
LKKSQYKICKNRLKLVLENRNLKTENRKGIRKKGKNVLPDRNPAAVAHQQPSRDQRWSNSTVPIR